jgi:DNA-directed RNA polymerase subunit M/transcription elongation factor TFIIS
MVMWNTGSCPKCGGDIFADVDENVLFDHCLQCSYMRPRANEPCPQCYFGMYYDYDRGERYSYCSNCGYSTRMHRVF